MEKATIGKMPGDLAAFNNSGKALTKTKIAAIKWVMALPGSLIKNFISILLF